jgi:AraC-like DNA-binding protein
MLKLLIVDNPAENANLLPDNFQKLDNIIEVNDIFKNSINKINFYTENKKNILLELSSVLVSINSSSEVLHAMQISLQESIEVSSHQESYDQIEDPEFLLRFIKLFYEIFSIFKSGDVERLQEVLIKSDAEINSIKKDKCHSIFPSIPRFQQIFEFIESHYSQSISPKDVAEHCGYSPSYLTDLMRRKTGYSMNHWIIKRRIEESYKLLRETDLSIEQISQLIGYRNTSHFFRQFQKLNGVSPQIWRKLQQNQKA